MKVLLFLSRFALICNVCFLLFIFFRWLEMRKPVHAASDRVLGVPFLKELVITLGFTAIIINLIMNVVSLSFLLSGRMKLFPRWLLVTNAIFLLIQVYYFFFTNY